MNNPKCLVYFFSQPDGSKFSQNINYVPFFDVVDFYGKCVCLLCVFLFKIIR